MGNKKHQKQKPKPTQNNSSKLGIVAFTEKHINTLLIIVGVVTFLVYAKALGYGFIYNWDDAGYIFKNDYIKTLSVSSVAEIFSSFHMHNYHPLTTLSYAIEYALVGETAWLYHLNNLLLHLANTWLVYVLMMKLTTNKHLPAILAAALFALHPMHVESVAWISERKDVLYSLFFLLGIIKYLNYIKTNKRTEYTYSLLFFILSCFSKSAAVTFPVLLFAIDYLYKRKPSLLLFAEKAPMLVISLVFGLLAIKSQDTAIQDLTPMLGLGERLLIVCWGICLYIGKVILPFELSAFYPYPIKTGGILPWYYFMAPLLVAAFGLVVFYSKKIGREVIFGTAFFFITISLVLQLMPVGGAIIAERYTYIPYIGFFFIMTLPLKKLYETSGLQSKNISLIFTRILLVVLLVFAWLTHERVKIWEDGDKLFTDVIEKYPQFPYAYNNRGFLYFDYYVLKKYTDNEVKKKAYTDKAYADYSMAIALDPTYVGAYVNRAVLLYNTGKPQPALDDFNKLLTLDPKNKDGLIGRANTLSTLEFFEESIIDYDNYLKIKDDDGKAWLWRGIAHSKTNNNEMASKDFEVAIQFLPDDYEPYYWQGISKHQLKLHTEAIQYFDKAIQLNPNNYEIFSWRGLAHYELKNIDHAIADFTTAINMNPEELSSYINRSIAHNEAGRYEEAFNDLIFAAERGMPISRNYYEELFKRTRR